MNNNKGTFDVQKERNKLKNMERIAKIEREEREREERDRERQSSRYK